MIPSDLLTEKKFIVYNLIPSERPGGKMDKKPLWDWSDPSRWMTAADAERYAVMLGAGYGIGYVITEDSGRFFYDIDSSRNPQTGELNAVATEAMRIFSTAYREGSVSLTGIHVLGKYRGPRPAHRCTNKALGLELYTGGRWVALGTPFETLEGANTDCTEGLNYLIATYFPVDVAATRADLPSDGPVPEWNGPTEDAELIRRAMQSRSASSAFSGKASFADLWLCNEQVLAANYPDAGGRHYDASAADAALAQHLAFWTGCDSGRMLRIMQRTECGLGRDKYEREDYLQRTIINAVARCTDVCNDKRNAQEAERRREQISENLRISEGSDVLPIAGEILFDEMVRRFAAVTKGKLVIDLDDPRRIFSEDDWKASLSSSKTVMEVKGKHNEDGSKKTKPYATTDLWRHSSDRQQIDTVTFRPGYPLMTRDPNEAAAINTWRPFIRSATTGDASLFVEHVEYLFGSDSNRFLDWLAHIEQFPGELPHTCWVHVSPAQGTGRNLLASILTRVWKQCVAPNFDLSETLRTGYSGLLSKKVLAIVDEINAGGSNSRWEHSEKLKSAITCERRSTNEKYGQQFLEYNCVRWLMFSNFMSAIPMDNTDRRFNVVVNEKPLMPKEHYKKLWVAIKDPEFIGAVAWFFKNRDLSNFDLSEHAPMSEAKQAMIAASRSEAEEALVDLVANHHADVITNQALGHLLSPQFGKLLPAHRHAMNRAGIKPYGTTVRPVPGALGVKVSIVRNHPYWKTATVEQVRLELAKLPGMPNAAAEDLSDFANFAADLMKKEPTG